MANSEGSIIDVKLPIDFDKVSMAKEYCDVHYGNHYIKSLDGLNKFEIYLNPDEIEGNLGIHITVEKTVPTFKPGTAHWDANGKYFTWLCTLPSATITGTVTKISGNRYHDHNWGNCPMNEILSDWLWSRAEVNGYTVVTSSVRFNEANGGEETKFSYLTKGNDILLNAINDEVICLEGEKFRNLQQVKKIAEIVYIVKKDKDYNYIRFQGLQTVASFPFSENKEYRTWYTRFVANTVLNLTIDGKEIKEEAHSTLEVMCFFGKKSNKINCKI